MPNSFRVLVALLVSFGFASGLAAQAPPAGAPDLSGVWESLGGLPDNNPEVALCGIQGVCAALTGIKQEPNPNTADEPDCHLPTPAFAEAAADEPGDGGVRGPPR